MQPQAAFGISVLPELHRVGDGRCALHLAGLQGAAYFIPTVLVPLLLVTHIVVFRILLGTNAVVGAEGGQARIDRRLPH